MTSDIPTLIVARGILRDAYSKLYALDQRVATVRCLINDLAEMAHDVTVEIEAEQPELVL